MKKTLILGVLFTVAVVLGSSSAFGLCNPPTNAANTGGGPLYGGAYLNFADGGCVNTGGPDAGGNWIGRFWQTGAPASFNQGNCQVANCGQGGADWVRCFNGFPGFESFYINFGDGLTSTGCPVGSDVTVYIENTTTDKFIMWTVPQSPGQIPDWNFSVAQGGPGTFVPTDSARPRVISSNRAATDVNVNFTVQDPTPSVFAGGTGFAGAVTDVQVFSCASATLPGSSVTGGCAGGNWVFQASLGATGGTTTVPVDCTNETVQQWLASGFEIDGQAPFFVGEPVEVECDPTLADPDNRKQRIQRPGNARPNRDAMQ
jgi:hypothetical protein